MSATNPGFEAGPTTGPLSESVLQDLPKISLHDHLDGAVRPRTIIELGAAIGLDLPTTDAAELGAWFLNQSTTGSLVDYLRSFDITTAVMRDAAGLERVAREYVLDVADDGVIYGEVRWAPEQSATDTLSMDEAVEAVLAGLAAGAAEVRAAGGSTAVTLLLCAMRQNDRSGEVAELALRHRSNRAAGTSAGLPAGLSGVVGFDIAGPERGFPPSAHRAAFERLAAEHLPVTVHAGEADDLPSIASALLDGRALRLGHGTRLALDITEVTAAQPGEDAGLVLGPLATWVRDRGIALELSPTSNLHTGAIAHWGQHMSEHPFDLLYRSGMAVTVNTDNRLMSRTTLTDDLAALVEAFGYGLAELEQFQINAARATFLPAAARADLIERIRAGFGAAGAPSTRDGA